MASNAPNQYNANASTSGTGLVGHSSMTNPATTGKNKYKCGFLNNKIKLTHDILADFL